MSEPYVPLSDEEFVRVMHDAIVNRDGETIEELGDDARYHRARVRELERQCDKAIETVGDLARSNNKLEVERDEFRWQVEAARTALERMTDAYHEVCRWKNRVQADLERAMCETCFGSEPCGRHALAPQTGEVGP